MSYTVSNVLRALILAISIAVSLVLLHFIGVGAHYLTHSLSTNAVLGITAGTALTLSFPIFWNRLRHLSRHVKDQSFGTL